MTPQEIQNLLGGYATGTLTDAEQQALFEAALHDQALFDALAREQSLADLLRDPSARAHLLTALEPAPRRPFWTWRPIAAMVAMAAIATVAVVIARRPHPVLVGQALPPVNTSPVVRSQLPEPTPVAEAEPPRPVRTQRRKAVAPPVAKDEIAAPSPQPAPAPAAPPPAPASVPSQAPQLEAANQATQQQVQVTAATPLAPVATSRTDMFASENQPAPKFAQPLTLQQARIAPPGARQIFFGAQAGGGGGVGVARALVAGVPQPANLALRYTILRRDANGVFVEVDRSDLSPSDTVELRFTAKTSGFLTVGDATPVSLTAMEPYTTPVLSALPAELKIVFAPQPQRQSAPAAVPITEVVLRDTYVTTRSAGQPLTFTIKLP